MDVTFLIDAIVRETTVLTAQLAGQSARRAATATATDQSARRTATANETGFGRVATLAHAADQVFSGLTRELRSQGASHKGMAELFGVSLRTFHNRVSRLSESRTEPGHALWEAVYTYIDQHGPLTLPVLVHRFSADGKAGVLGVVKELVESGLVFRTGADARTLFRVARPDEHPRTDASESVERLAAVLWIAVHRFGPVTRAALAERVPVQDRRIDDALVRLQAEGLIEQNPSEGEASYRAREVLIPWGSSAGWEAAVADHYQALVTTVTTKLRLWGRRSAANDWVGGSTYSIELTREHPLFEEVVGFLSSTRQRAVSLRRRVEELKRHEPDPSEGSLNVILYVGQTVVGLHGEGELTESRRSRRYSHRRRTRR